MTQHERTDAPVNAPIWPKPPVVALIFVLCGLALDQLMPLGVKPIPRENMLIGSVIIACSVAVAALAARELFQARTTILPGKPANAFVTSGVFRRSRNPIYLSFVLFLLGLGVATANPWMFFLAPFLALYLRVGVISREETYLRRRFGEEYSAYRRKVRRWF